MAFLAFGAARLAAWWWQRRAFSRGAGVKQLVVVGTGAAAVEFEGFVAARPWLGARCVGALSVLSYGTEAERSGGLIRPTPVLGRLGDPGCGALCAEADALVLALDDDERQDLALVVRQVEEYGVPFHIIPSLFERTYAVAGGGYPAGLSTLSYRVEPMYRTQRGLKRLLDTLGALVALILLSPLFLVVAALVKLTSPGPVFFRQERVGEHGRRFAMLKFRTMYEDAEQRLAEVAHLNEGEDVLFKIRDDPRITPVGRCLRRWSIDELPQFWNVLRGDMSVVGPRPPLPREVDAYEMAQLARLRGKPGITGLWQVSGRSDLSFEHMVDLDRSYIENWSLGLDLSIALRTVLAIVRRRGAY